MESAETNAARRRTDRVWKFFCLSVERYATRPAVVSGNVKWSYKELSERAAAVAERLLGLRVARRSRVALLFEHEPDALVAILATLKCGLTYVPLDPQWPEVRSSSVIRDCIPAVLLTKRSYSERATRLLGESVKCLYLDDEKSSRQQTLGLRKEFSSDSEDSLAYILYTSGSTGRPKGVMQTQDHLCEHVVNYIRSITLTSDDRVLLLASFAFDASVMDIFGALFSGATLVIFDPRHGRIVLLPEYIQAVSITVYHSTPSAFRSLMSACKDGQLFPSVRRVVLGGEMAYRSDYLLFRQHFLGDAVLVNGYGPTECTLALQSFLTHDSEVHEARLGVGNAVPGVIAELRNTGSEGGGQMSDVGELYLIARHLAVGYWKDTTSTLAKFLREPGAGVKRVYRTGDVAKAHRDGSFEIIARCDSQFKVRGHTVEPAEVEGALLNHPSIDQVVVELVQSSAKHEELVAYIVGRPEVGAVSSEIRHWLGERLPYYMVPQRFIMVPSFPQTSTNKVDRRALSSYVRSTKSRVVERPRALKADLEALWCKSLDIDQIPADATYYSLGGDSLSAVHLYLDIASEFNTQLSFEELFATPTLKAMREVLARRASPESDHIQQVSANGTGGHLSDAQLRFWHRTIELDRPSSMFNVSIVYRFRTAVSSRLLKRAVQHVVAQHHALRLQVYLTQQVIRQIGLLPSQFFMEEIDLGSIRNKEVNTKLQSYLCERASVPFELCGEPLVRFTHIISTDGTSLLQMTYHHLVMDGWSRQIVDQTLLRYLETNGASSFPFDDSGSERYTEFVLLERAQGTRGSLQQNALQFWKTILDAAHFEVVRLPGRVKRSSFPSFRAASIVQNVSSEASESLRKLCKREGVTLFTGILAVLTVVLHSFTNQMTLYVTTDVAKRENPRWSHLVGLLADVLVIKCSLDYGVTFSDYLKSLSQTVRAALDNQSVSFRAILEATGICTLGQYHEAFPLAFFYEKVTRDTEQQQVAVTEISSLVASRDLIVTASDNGKSIQMLASYREELFAPEYIEAVMARCAELLESGISGRLPAVPRPMKSSGHTERQSGHAPEERDD